MLSGLTKLNRSPGLESDMAGPGPFDRWISFELGRLNAGLVVEKKTLSRLLAEPEPACRTREGDPHPFDRTALDRYAAVLSRDQAEDLRLPLTLVASSDSDSAYLTDELGAKALRAVEKFDRAFPFRDGRMALPHSLAVDRVPVFRLEHVVDDPFRVTEEVEDMLGHRPGLFLLHPGPVDRVLDRPREVVDGQRPGRSPL